MIRFALIGLLLAGPAAAESISAPAVRDNDTWTYQETVENRTGWHQTNVESTVQHVSANGIAISNRTVGSTMPPTEGLLGPDWSRFRSVNGHETVVNRPLAFPLSVGKAWVVEYTEDHPNREHTSEHLHHDYKVVGWEDVTVPAGTFHALKIESDGQWSAAVAPAATAASAARADGQGVTSVNQITRTRPGVVTGRTYKAFWYVPAVKRWVKSVEEYYSATGVRNERYENDLLSYKVAG